MERRMVSDHFVRLGVVRAYATKLAIVAPANEDEDE